MCRDKKQATVRVTERDREGGTTLMTCTHSPGCPPASARDREAARVVSSHPEQGWSLLCNGVLLFDDTGELLPDGQVIAPHRPTDPHHAAA
jgi:hypothetical protein